MKKIIALIPILTITLVSCSNDENNTSQLNTLTFTFNHNWDGTPVSSNDFNQVQYTNANGDHLSIERLRYLISDVTFTGSQGETLRLESFFLVDLTNNRISFTTTTPIPQGNYNNVAFTFGFDNEDNNGNYPELNTANFNVPEMLGGGYHYMQFDGKFINSNNEEQGFNYHAIRAVDNPGDSPTFPQDTFINVNLGGIAVSANTEIEVDVNLAQWFKEPNLWDLNQLNSVLMPNSDAQIMMYENGQNVFSLSNE